MSVEAIYKIAHIINNKIKTIYVFIGKPHIEGKNKNLDKLFLQHSSDKVFTDVFSNDELTSIAEHTISVKFIPERLHLDDTIENIKKKVLLHLMQDLNASFDELYFFIRQYEQFNAITLYQNLTQNEKLDLSKERLMQFLLNIPDLDINILEDKPIYTYADIVSFNLEQEPMLITKPLGQKIISLNADYTYPYTVNPFDAAVYDSFIEKFADELTTTTNKNILMQHGSIVDNTIYLCLAEDVLKNASDSNLSEHSTLKLYFPYLNGKDIVSLAQLKDKKQTLLGESRAMLTPVFEKNNENINLFYDIYANRKEELKFSEVGIKSIVFKLLPTYAFNLPLDIVFKLIHATQSIPLIKMNLSKRQENIYRLYADKLAQNGKKIPYLDKGAIFKWDKVMAKNKSVSVYIEHYEEAAGTVSPILCEFENNGTIIIKATFSASVKLDILNEIINKEVNPVIMIIKEYLSQSGYNLNTFTDIKSASVEIINIDYTLHIPVEKHLKIKTIVGCVSSMFNIISDSLEQGIMLRFKRVSNYSEMESQEALIIDMSNPYLGYTDADIIKVLQSNFNLKEGDAREKYAEVKRAQEVMQFANRKLKSLNNPGFLTTIVKQPFSNIIMITVSGINNIGYLDTLYIYIDSLLRITQNQSSTKVSKNAIKELCKGHKIEEEEHIEEIYAIAEQATNEPVIMNIVAEELVFNKPNAPVLDQEPAVVNAEEAPTEQEAAEQEAAEQEEAELDEEDLLARFGYEEEEEEVEESGGARKGAADTSAADASAADTSAADTSAAEDDESDVEEESATDSDDMLKTDLTGLNLSNPNPFSKRMLKRDKTLFYTEDGKKNFKAYSRTCPWNVRRQPVILTKEELDEIDKKHPGSYDQKVEYGATPENKFFYICPRYWSLRDNTSLRYDEVNQNEVISKDAKKIPAGKHIFEFNDYGKEHYDETKENNYIIHRPGFLKPDKNGKCLPCCFKGKWKDQGNEQADRRAQCSKNSKTVVPTGRKKKKPEEEIDEYILSHDKFPMVQENRFGYLPLAIQKFLHTDNKKCQISDQNTNIKENHTCLLRHSVEIHQTQSFVGCIADIWYGMYGKSKKIPYPSIKRMKELFIEAMDIDTFITLQNGNLIQLFYPSAAEAEAEAEADLTTDSAAELTGIQEYAEIFSKQNSKLYQVADKTKPEQMNLLIKISKSYIKFIDYLKDDTVEIDYSYLWDLICKPNSKLFPSGLNLVILELLPIDMTENVEIICPSNHYSSSFFDSKKFTVIILKINNFYEPIYAYETTKTTQNIDYAFNLFYKDTLPNIKNTLNLIKKSMHNKCGALPSMPTDYRVAEYKFEKNIPLDKVVHWLEIRNYQIDKQVLNYDSKVIGVVAINKETNDKCFVPCYPSAPVQVQAPVQAPANLIWMDDVYTDTYENTKSFLEKVYNETQKKIPCKPVIKVLEDGLIVGLLTMTNQFVLLSQPTQDTFGDDLKIINNANYTAIDKKISTSQKVDDERISYIKKIKLETNFYNVFRGLARHLLGQFQNKEIRREIEEKSSSNQLYLKKIHSIEQLLRTLMKEYVVFYDYDEKLLLTFTTITNCYGECKNKPFCQPKEGGSENENGCALKIPMTNLINQKSNDEFYFGKLADELVRYSRIKTFIFNPKNVLTFTSLKYNLRENEIILLQSLLTQDYFQNLVAAPVNQYISYNTFETTKPIKTQNYSNVESFKQFIQPDIEAINKAECIDATKDVIENDYWRKVFPLNSKETRYKSNPLTCSFNAILTIIKDDNELTRELTKNDLKEILVEEYERYYAKYDKLILNILKAQGKKLLANQIMEKQLTLTNMIMSEDYYATNLDVWILIVHYNLQVVLFSTSLMLENNAKFLLANSTGSQDYYFLKVSAARIDYKPPLYTLITDVNNALKINIGKLRSINIQDKLRESPVGNTLNKFIETFSITMANKRKRRDVEPLKVAEAVAAVATVATSKTVKPKTVKLNVIKPSIVAPVAPPTVAPAVVAPMTVATVAPVIGLKKVSPLVKKLGKKLKLNKP